MIPWSMAKSDGSLDKCNKSVTLDELEKYKPEPRSSVQSDDVLHAELLILWQQSKCASTEVLNHSEICDRL